MSKSQEEIAGLGQPVDVRAPGDNVWRAFDASSPPDPGTQVRIRAGDGKQYITTYNGPDDFSDPVPTTIVKGPAKQAPTDVLTSADLPGAKAADPTGAMILDHLAGQLQDPDVAQAVKDQIYPQYAQALNTVRGEISKATTVDTNTQGLAQSAEQKLAAGIKPSVTELAALNRVQASLGGGAGQAASTPVTQAIDATTSDERVRLAMKMGASLEGGLGSTFNAGDGGMSWGPFQINHNSGMHADISREDAEDPEKAAQYMLGSYQTAVSKVPDALWTSNPKQAAAQAAYLAEKPAVMYPSTRVDSSWNALTGGGGLTLPGPNKQHTTINGKEYTFDPASGTFTDTGLGFPAAPPTKEINGLTFQYDPKSGQYKPSNLPPDKLAQQNLANARLTAQKLQQELLPKAQLALSQQYDTVKYIQAQLAAGNMTPAEANGYMNEVKAQTSAALAGTTPEAIWAKAQDIETARATQAKDMLDTELQQGSALTDALLNHALPAASDKLLVNPSVPFDYSDVMGAAKANVQQYIPEGLNDTARSLLETAWGPQGLPPGAYVPDSGGGTPGATPPPGPDTAGAGLPPGAYVPAAPSEQGNQEDVRDF